MPTVSYSQNFEDVVLARAFGEQKSGFYVDLGAWHPVIDSITHHFYLRGWRGINVEPMPAYLELLERERPEDVNLGVGIAARPGELTFYQDITAPGRSTFSREQAARLRSEGHEIRESIRPVITLAEVFADHAPIEIDFLKIDVEGKEREAIESGDWERWRPKIVLVEATAPGSRAEAHRQWEDLLLDAGYVFALFDGLNRFFVREESQELLPWLDRPANVLDDFVPYQHVQEIEGLRHRLQALEAYLAEYQVEAERYVSSLRESLEQKEVEMERLFKEAERRDLETMRFVEALKQGLLEKEESLRGLEQRLAEDELTASRAQSSSESSELGSEDE